MATVFWDAEGVLLIRYLHKNCTINSETYVLALKDLWDAICRKQPHLDLEAEFYMHDNAQPHILAFLVAFWTKLKWYEFGHLMYSPELASLNY